MYVCCIDIIENIIIYQKKKKNRVMYVYLINVIVKWKQGWMGRS